MDDEKQIRWVGSAYDDLLAFPKDARKEAGFQLGKVQAGLEASGIYRVMYVAKFEEAIYVLHCFQKKTQVTSKQDRAIAAARYRAVVNVRKEKK
jgi:phage-related protein